MIKLKLVDNAVVAIDRYALVATVPSLEVRLAPVLKKDKSPVPGLFRFSVADADGNSVPVLVNLKGVVDLGRKVKLVPVDGKAIDIIALKTPTEFERNDGTTGLNHGVRVSADTPVKVA